MVQKVEAKKIVKVNQQVEVKQETLGVDVDVENDLQGLELKRWKQNINKVAQ